MCCAVNANAYLASQIHVGKAPPVMRQPDDVMKSGTGSIDAGSNLEPVMPIANKLISLFMQTKKKQQQNHWSVPKI